MKLWILLLFCIQTVLARITPVVLWHGMGDTCCSGYSLGSFKLFLERTVPGIIVVSLRIGNNTVEDLENGYFMTPNKQVDYVCDKLSRNPFLKNGFHAIGFSQGGQFFRAVAQRCGHKIPPIKNMISLGGQHQGVYGLPHCGALQHASCDYVRKLLNHAAYYKWVQEALVQATYWHDPLNEVIYQQNSIFLSDINNELTINQTYVDNLSRLEKLVLVKFGNDTIVQPRETEWFGFYEPGQAKKMITLQESRLYIEDRLGLKKMEKDGKLIFLATAGDHLRFSDVWFIDNIIKPYLNTTSASY